MRFLRRSLIGLFLTAVTFGLLTWAGALVTSAIRESADDARPDRGRQERVYAVNVVALTPETVRPEIVTFGEIDSRRRLEIRAPASGRIAWLSGEFEDGSEVSAGEVLMRLDDRDARGTRDSAAADLAEAEADLRDARRSVELARSDLGSAEDQAALRERALARQRDLVDRGVATEAAVETAEFAAQTARQSVINRQQALAQAEARADQATTALERSRIALAEAERRLADTEVTAPFDGVLSGVEAVEGGLVGANENLATLVDPDRLEVSFRISTGQYARLLESGRITGLPVTASITVSGIDIRAEGTVSRESPAVEDGQTGRLLFASLDAAPGFRPGDFVTVRITEPPLEDVARLPSTAIDAEGRLLAVGEEERLESVAVELLRRQGDDILVAAGDLAGRQVVAVRTPFLGAGIRVRPLVSGEPVAEEAEEMVSLDPDRRARLIAFVEGSRQMPDAAKARILAALKGDQVPADMVARIESRMGG